MPKGKKRKGEEGEEKEPNDNPLSLDPTTLAKLVKSFPKRHRYERLPNAEGNLPKKGRPLRAAAHASATH